MPEIHLVTLRSGAEKLLLKKAAVLRWMPDSKALLILKIEEKVKDTYNRIGQIATIEAATGKLTPLAWAYGGSGELTAVSPDRKKVLFTALSASVGDAKPDTKATEKQLFELDVAGPKLRKIDRLDRKVDSARYSPSGKKVLMVAEPKDAFFTEKRDLLVADADMQEFKTIARDAYTPLVKLGDNACFPGWIGDETIYYFSKVSVYGTTGHALRMRQIGVDGKSSRDVQPDIDLAVTEIAEATPKLELKK
jgi:hypothetical protein